MFEFHKDKSRYFQMQYEVTKEYVIPFLENHIDLDKSLNVLEIGCAEAGVLKAFLERGHNCTGIELYESRIKLAEKFLAKEVAENRINFICKNIFDIDPANDLPEKFDLILLKDVIEHIHDQTKFMEELNGFLKPTGKVFFGFPPWQMPFGGHQQICKGKVLSKLPYYHLLPQGIYKSILKMGNEPDKVIDDLLEIKETGISIERFEGILKREGYTTHNKKLFLINPIYKYKFNLAPRDQFSFIKAIPGIRNFLSTCAYYLVSPKANKVLEPQL